MPELIDKQASMKAICDGCFKSRAVDLELRCRGTCNVIDILQQQPTIEAEPVRLGRWIEVTKHRDENGTILTDYECSECFAMLKDSYPEEIEGERFCYNCGADMREGGAGNVSNV